MIRAQDLRLRCGALAFTAIQGCSDPPTQIVVTIEADAVVLSQLHEVRVSTRREGVATESDAGVYALPPFSLRPPGNDGHLALRPSDLDDARRIFVTVEGVLSTGRSVRHVSLVRYVRDHTVYLSVPLEMSCVGVTCTDAARDTCLAGQCATVVEQPLRENPTPSVIHDASVFDGGDAVVPIADAVNDRTSDLVADTMQDASTDEENRDATTEPPTDRTEDVSPVVDVLDAPATCVTDVVCAEETTCCPEQGCFDLTTDATHCGRCDQSCAALPNAAPICVAGVCATRCVTGFANCDGSATNGCETDLMATADHCGSCETACSAANHQVARCVSGACSAVCASGYADCDGLATNGCEVNTRGDSAHCGRCENTCLAGPHQVATCAAGACGTACVEGYADCNGLSVDGCEVDTRSDAVNCGRCGSTCSATAHQTATCVAGVCGARCEGGWGDCNGSAADGCETDLQATTTHCGSCATTCAAGAHQTASCAAGACGVSCNTGFADCNATATDGCESDTRNDAANCGRCGMACSAGLSCDSGVCRRVCTAGQTVCGDACVDLMTDRANCATCGNRCAAGQRCTAGFCANPCAAGQAYCVDRCIPLNTHDDCGACGRNCGGGACVSGNCTPYRIAELPSNHIEHLTFDGSYLYAVDYSGGPIYRVRIISPGTPERINDGAPRILGIRAFGGNLYWASLNDDILRWMPLSGGTEAMMPIGGDGTGDILIESDFVYSIVWSNTTPSPIYRTPRAGGTPIHFADLPASRGQALWRVSTGELLAGSQFSTVVWQVPPIGGAATMFVDLGSGRNVGQIAEDDLYLYIVSERTDEVLRLNRTTHAVDVLIPMSPQIHIPTGIVVTDTMIYYSNYDLHDIWAMRK